MAMTYKILGQKSPAATTDFNLYTVSGSKQAIINCITVANRDANSATYRISVRPDGATLTTLFKGVPVVVAPTKYAYPGLLRFEATT